MTRIARIRILFNKISGSGSAAVTAQKLERALSPNRKVELLESQVDYSPQQLVQLLDELDLLVVVGGDGTIRPLLKGLGNSQIPIYAHPSGNESLFSREFGMRDGSACLLAALERGKIEEAYIGKVNGTYFFHMVSIGLDSLVVSNAARGRGGPLGNLGYVVPTLRAFANYRAPLLEVTVDGKLEINSRAGWLVIGGSKQYAGNLTPVPEADWHRPGLAARFFPFTRMTQHLPQLFNYFLRKPIDVTDSILLKGSHFQISCSSGNTFPVQADGDFVGELPLSVARDSTKVRILIPPDPQ